MTRLATILILLAGSAHAAPISTTFDGSSLVIRFGDGTDYFRPTEGPGGIVYYTDENSSNFYGLGQPLLTDAGETIPSDRILMLDIDMGDGQNALLNPGITVQEFSIVRGGSGRDVFQSPYGDRVSFALLGDGNDQYIASVTGNNWVWGEGGDDSLHAGFFGVDYLDGGLGSNSMSSYSTSTTTFVHHGGSTNHIIDNGGNSRYIILPSEEESMLTVYDTGGSDSIHLGGHSWDVVNDAIISDTISGQFFGWSGIEVIEGGQGAGVPEPCGIALLILATGLLCLRR